MQAYRIETTIKADGELALSQLPLKAGEKIEVIILTEDAGNKANPPKRINSLLEKKSAVSKAHRQQVLAQIRNGLFSSLRKPGTLSPSEEYARRKIEEKELEERRLMP